MEILIIWIIFGIIAGCIAGSKNRSGFGWFLAVVLFSPLMILLLLLLPSIELYQPPNQPPKNE